MDRDVTEHYSHNGRYLGTLKVGTKGQILIPKEVRDFFGMLPPLRARSGFQAPDLLQWC